MTLLLPFGPLHGINGSLAKQAAAFMADMESAELYDFAVSLGLDLENAKPLWHQFIADGYIAQDSSGRHVPTELMDELSRARFGNPLPRKKAEALLQQAIRNAEAANAEPPTAQLYYVTKLAVFGSFLDESKQELGDLDLAWEIEERPGVENFAHHCIMYNKDSVAPTRGRVRPKSSMVRLASMENLLGLQCPYRLVYEFNSEVLDQIREDRQRRREIANVQWETSEKRMRAMLDDLTTVAPARRGAPRPKRP